VSVREGEPRRSSLVALLEKRGRFLIGQPFFARGPQLIVGGDRRAAAGDLVLLALGLRGGKLLRRSMAPLLVCPR